MKSALKAAQCCANIEALLLHYEMPLPAVAERKPDRTFFHWRGGFITRMNELVPKYFAAHIPWSHGRTAAMGWREEVARFSLQLVMHRDGRIEADVDLYNPGYGAGPAFLHMWECIWPGKTDPFKVLKGLRARGFNVSDVRDIKK